MTDENRTDIPPPPTATERPDALSLALNYLPLLQLCGGVAVCSAASAQWSVRGALMLAWIYLLPPLVSRLSLALWGRPDGRVHTDHRSYRVWWFLTQWQMVFNRLPALEELLRLVPGLYAAWIWLWGGSLSPFSFVGPGVIVTDRYLLDVRRGAVLGMKSALIGHTAVRDDDGRFVVILAAPVVERDAILSGGAAIGPGAVVHAGHRLPAGQRLAPYSEWPRRLRKTEEPT